VTDLFESIQSAIHFAIHDSNCIWITWVGTYRHSDEQHQGQTVTKIKLPSRTITPKKSFIDDFFFSSDGVLTVEYMKETTEIKFMGI
jgi:hypothetical protein